MVRLIDIYSHYYRRSFKHSLNVLKDEEDEEEMTTPLYLISSILFLTGCLFYTSSAILWYALDVVLHSGFHDESIY